MKNKSIFGILLALTLVIPVHGCAASDPVRTASDTGEKTVVSMLYPLSLDHFEALVEETFKDIDLEVELNTTATLNGDSERRLRNRHGTDLIVTTLPTGDVQNYALDLSAEDFAGKYQATAMSPIRIEGQVRYLPLPGQYSGYILNRTLMEQLGVTLPASNDELLALLAAGKSQGVGIGEDGAMFGLEMVDPAAFGSYIIGTQVPDFLGEMAGMEWMADFKSCITGFSGVWDDSMKMPLACAENGYLNTSALQLTSTNAIPVESRMLDGTLLISYGNIRLLKLLNERSEAYEYVMLPFLSDAGREPWTISAPDGYIAINNALEGADSSAVLDACRRILGLLSTRQGQDAWVADTQATASYLEGNRSNTDEVPACLTDCVRGGYVYNLQMPSNIVLYFGRNMISVLSGKTGMSEALAAVDDYCRNGSASVDYDQSVVGSVAEDLLYENYNTRCEETAIGNLVADAVAEYAGAEIAVVNGGGIRASLYAGDVLGADLAAVCPYDNKVILVETDGATIRDMLENGIALVKRDDSIPSGRFLQVSGLCYSYRPMTEETPPELLEVTLPDGSPLDAEKRYSLAIIDYMAGASGYLDNNGDGYTMLNLYSDTCPKATTVTLLTETNKNYADVLRAYFGKHRDKAITAKPEGRITVVEGDE